MARKIKVAIKKRDSANMADIDEVQNKDKTNYENEIPDTPTCIRCYLKNEKDIQTLNGMLLRFNIGKDNLVIQRVGYKMTDGRMAEIDIAALHAANYSANPTEYAVINHWLSSFMKENNIEFKFIDFSDCYKNSADCHLAIDGMSTLGEFITIEKGSVTDELFEYIRNRLNLPMDIVSISIPVHDETGIFITYHTEWIRGEVRGDNKNEDATQTSQNDTNTLDISVSAYTEDASDSIDLIISQFGSAIGRSVYDYTENANGCYYRVIRMTVTLNETGKRLIDSLDWVKDVVISKS